MIHFSNVYTFDDYVQYYSLYFYVNGMRNVFLVVGIVLMWAQVARLYLYGMMHVDVWILMAFGALLIFDSLFIRILSWVMYVMGRRRSGWTDLTMTVKVSDEGVHVGDTTVTNNISWSFFTSYIYNDHVLILYMQNERRCIPLFRSCMTEKQWRYLLVLVAKMLHQKSIVSLSIMQIVFILAIFSLYLPILVLFFQRLMM